MTLIVKPQGVVAKNLTADEALRALDLGLRFEVQHQQQRNVMSAHDEESREYQRARKLAVGYIQQAGDCFRGVAAFIESHR